MVVLVLLSLVLDEGAVAALRRLDLLRLLLQILDLLVMIHLARLQLVDVTLKTPELSNHQVDLSLREPFFNVRPGNIKIDQLPEVVDGGRQLLHLGRQAAKLHLVGLASHVLAVVGQHLQAFVDRAGLDWRRLQHLLEVRFHLINN